MSDFSFFSLFTAGLALFAPLSAAYTKPVGDSPKGNPISQPGFMSIVPAGKPFTVTWEPTTPGTVTLVLLKGPSTNAQPQYPIAEKIDNSGSFVWTPKTNLEPTADAEGYGIQLIDDKTGQYQYTTQFGISNPKYDAADDSSSSAAPSSTTGHGGWSGHGGHGGQHGGWGHGGHNVHGGYSHSGAPSGTSSWGSSSSASSLTSSYTKSNGTITSGHAQPTGGYGHNITMVAPTGNPYTTSKTRPSPTSYSGSSASASTPAGPQATNNGAAGLAISGFGGFVLVAGAAVFAL